MTGSAAYRVLAAEFLKIRRSWIWTLIVLGPVGVLALQAVNFGLRYNYLTNYYRENLWGGVIQNVMGLASMALMIGLAIIASMTAGIEHRTNAWKQTLVLPVDRSAVFAGKFALNALLLLVSSTLLLLGTIIFGLLLGYGGDIPYRHLLEQCYFMFLAAMPFIALQVGLSVLIHNPAIPLSVGIVGTVAAMGAHLLHDWNPWKWPTLQNAANDPLQPALLGLVTGAVVLMVVMWIFVRKDVK